MKPTLPFISFLLFFSLAVRATNDSLIVTHHYGDSEDHPYGLENRYETHLDSLGRIKLSIWQQWNGYQFTSGVATLYNYDSNGYNFETIGQIQNVDTWINSSRTYRYYNNFQKIDSIAFQSWQNNSWVTTSGVYFTYDVNHHLIADVSPSQRNFYYPDSASHDTLKLTQVLIGANWIDVDKHLMTYDTADHKATDVTINYNRFTGIWMAQDSSTFTYYPNDSLFLLRDYYWWMSDSAFHFSQSDSIVYSNDTVYTYMAHNYDSLQLIYDSRNVHYDDGSGYNYYDSDYEFFNGSSWDSGGEYNICTYDSLTNIAHATSASTGSNDGTNYYFDSDGHLDSLDSYYHSHSGEYDTYGNSYYYYYLTHGTYGICPNTSDSLSVDTGMISYSWFPNGETLNNIVVNDRGTYYCNLVNEYGHPFPSEPHYQYVSLAPTATHDHDSSMIVCYPTYYGDLTAVNIPVYEYQWLRNDTALAGQNTYMLTFDSNFLDPQPDGNFRVVVRNGCGVDTSSATYINFPDARVHILPDTGYLYICPGDTITLTADSGFVSYLWNTGDTSRVVITTPGHLNTLVRAYDVNGCESINFNYINAAFDPSLLPLQVIQNDTILNASFNGGGNIHWFLDGVAIPSGAGSQIRISQTGFYKYQFTNGSCMFESEEIYVVYSSFRLRFTNDTIAKCFSQPILLNSSYYILSGGTPPFHFQWTPSTALSNDTAAATSCTAASDILYHLTVTDSLGQITTDSVFIVVNAAVNVTLSTLKDSICANTYNESGRTLITASITDPGNYTWYKNGSTFADGTNRYQIQTFQAGNYSLKFNNGCITYSDTITITNIPLVVPNVHPLSIPSDWCAVDSFGVVAEIMNPENYSVFWYNQNLDSAFGDTLYLHQAEIYYVRIVDNYGCVSGTSFNINAIIPDSVVPFAVDPHDMTIACFGDSVHLQSTHYNHFEYHWSNYDNLLPEISSTLTTTYSGHYFVTADNFGCHGSDSVYVSFSHDNANVSLDYNNQFLLASCNLYISDWQWFLDDTLIAGVTGSLLHPLRPGTYKVVGDAGNCGSDTATFIVNCTTSLSAFNITCNGNCNGSVIANALGISPFIYSWSTGETTQSISGLCEGTYNIVITDSSGCMIVDTFEITQPEILQRTLNSKMISCSYYCDGTSTIVVSGGTAPYTFIWSNGESESMIDTLCAGTYYVSVIDSNGCTLNDSVQITSPLPLQDSLVTTMTSCYQSCDGTAATFASGGIPPYGYHWIGGYTSFMDSLCAGSHLFSITDSNGCILFDTAMISSPALLATSLQSTMPLCYMSCTGSISATVQGGSPPYQYQWSNGSSSATIDSLCVGLFSILVSDSNGCTSVDSSAIVSPAELIVSDSITAASCVTCADGIVTLLLSGGTPPYSVLWSTNDTGVILMNVLPGDYLGCVTDVNGCNWCNTYTIGYNVIDNIGSSHEEETMSIRPNPFSSVLYATIYVDQIPEHYIFILTDDFGRKILMQTALEKITAIDGSSLADGIYYLQLADKGTLQVLSRKKVLVVH
jgi:hypothetical protein